MTSPIVYQTRTFRALDYVFSVAVEGHDAFGEYTEDLFESLVSDAAAPSPVPWVVRPAEFDDSRGWELVIDDARNSVFATVERLTPELVHTLNSLAVPSWSGVTCHAGGVARGDAGIVLPADMESGKTTLTAGLVRAGFSYLTDEAVAFHPGTSTIAPFPKPLSIDRGAWFLFPELEPEANFATDDYKQDQWQVPAAAIRPDAVGGPCEARLVVFPKYVEGAHTSLVRIRRAEALVELAKNTFSFNQKSRAALDDLAGVVRAVDCYRLTVGALDEAVALIEQLADELPAADADDA
ncbi:MAG: hypothetical protein ACHQDE_08995 [Acidimicrobiia bacterium]